MPPEEEPTELWCGWQREYHTNLIQAGFEPMVRAYWRDLETPGEVAAFAFGQAKVHVQNLMEARTRAEVDPDRPVVLCPQDLCGFHKRPDEPHSLFTPGLTPEEVGVRQTYYQESLRLFLGYWYAQNIWDPDALVMPPIGLVNVDMEGAHGEEKKEERDDRLYVVVKPARLRRAGALKIHNWNTIYGIRSSSGVFYSPDQAKIDKGIDRVESGVGPRNAWVPHPTAMNLKGEQWDPDRWGKLIDTLRQHDFTTFTVWGGEKYNRTDIETIIGVIGTE
jgi:hypothetical protein